MSSILLNTTKNCLTNLHLSLAKLNIGGNSLIQSRSKLTFIEPRLRNPHWFVRKNRTVHNDLVTSENQQFVKEVVHDAYGPPSIIKGVQSYKISTDVQNVATQEWTPSTRRTGAIARKIGQYPLWKKDGTKIRTTLLQIVDNHVIKYIPPNQYQPSQQPRVKYINQFGCLLVGAESTDPSLLTKEYCGLFKDSGVMPKKMLARFIISPSAALKPGTPINISHFRVGDHVDVRGKTVYHGFQGVIKRHGFKGMPASHGVTKTHRRGGNIGAGGNKARVFPGTKMPGHMGNRWRVARGLKIWRINTKYNVMWVTGSGIAGETNNMVYIFDSLLPLRRHKTSPPFPTCSTKEDDEESLAENIWHEDLHDFTEDTIVFKQDVEK